MGSRRNPLLHGVLTTPSPAWGLLSGHCFRNLVQPPAWILFRSPYDCLDRLGVACIFGSVARRVGMLWGVPAAVHAARSRADMYFRSTASRTDATMAPGSCCEPMYGVAGERVAGHAVGACVRRNYMHVGYVTSLNVDRCRRCCSARVAARSTPRCGPASAIPTALAPSSLMLLR